MKSKNKNQDGIEKTGESWLYSDVVKDHFFHPRNIFTTKEEEEKYEKEADGIGQVGSPACMPSDIAVCSDKGFVNIDKIDSNNKVFGYEGKFNNVKESKKRDYVGELVLLKSKLGKICLTPDHLVFSIKRPKGHKYDYTKNKTGLLPEWNYAKNLKKNDFIIYPRSNNSTDLEEINLNCFKKKYDFKSKDLPKILKITPELLRLFGYFIAEGSTRKNSLRANDIVFSFNIKEKEYVNDVIYLVKKYFNLGAKVTEDPSQNKCSVEIYNVHLSNIFKEWFGSGADKKKIPDFLMNLPLEKQQGLLCGLWRGDGYINTKRKFPRAGYVSISKELIHQIKILLLRMEIIPSLYEENEKISKWANHKRPYRIHIGDKDSLNKLFKIVYNYNLNYNTLRKNSWFDQDFFYTSLTKVGNQAYSGQIYNLEVKDSHSYSTDAFCVHNCGDVMKMYIKIDKKRKIKECKWKTFGCASAIASTSILSEMAIGMHIEDAKKITPQDIVKKLGGLPQRKIHCSVLGDQALRAAIKDYEDKKNKKV